jgi:hypothetical protein
MSKIFSGSSPQKALARAFAYSKVARKDFYGKTHIVIASRECGDIKFLLEHGVRKNHIVACDVDPEALKAAKKFGVRISPFADIERTTELFSAYGLPLASVNVDLCMTLKKGYPVLDAVLDLVYKKAKVFFTFCRYRDGMKSTEQRMRMFENLSGIGGQWDATPAEVLHYQSHTNNSIGSPMTVCVM